LDPKVAQSWPPGFALRPRAAGIDPKWLKRFRGLPTSWVGDAMGRRVGTVGLSAYHNDYALMAVGTAVTVRVGPGDNLMIHKAIELAEPGDVIVVDGGGDLCQALVGGNIRTTAIRKQISGFVIDGAIRDLADWAKGGIGVWARGHTLRGPSKEGPGEVNVPVSVAGLVVAPGDLVLGDVDGVLAIPPARLSTLWPEVQAVAEREAFLQASNASGSSDPERFNAILRAKGCPV
jgi:RraA family protein